jgi:hypothetical protein
MARERSAAAWCVCCCITIPTVLACVLSSAVVNVFVPRYLLFAQLFVLVGLGVLVWRAPAGWPRSAWGLLLLSLLAWADWREARAMHLSHRPGIAGAAAWIRRHHEGDEPVLVCSWLNFLPMTYHLGPRIVCREFRDRHPSTISGGEKPQFYVVTRPEEVLCRDQLLSLPGERCWVVECERGNPAYRGNPVPMPPVWKVLGRWTFREVWTYQGELVVILYGRQNGSSAGRPSLASGAPR